MYVIYNHAFGRVKANTTQSGLHAAPMYYVSGVLCTLDTADTAACTMSTPEAPKARRNSAYFCLPPCKMLLGGWTAVLQVISVAALSVCMQMHACLIRLLLLHLTIHSTVRAAVACIHAHKFMRFGIFTVCFSLVA
jgi:hypothetical protein